jgi:hypothetical protein
MKEIKAHAHKVHKARHAHLGLQSTTQHSGFASGGAQHPHKGHSAADERADTALVHSLVKPDALKRASGGRAHKGKSGTHVNIMVGRPGGDTGPGAAGPMPMIPPGGGAGPMPMPPPAMAGRGPMPPMGAGGPPPGGIGGAPVLPPRKHGGRAKHR